VLYLGCNILRTPEVAAEVVAVFRALGLDFIAVAGVQSVAVLPPMQN
jgi:hypothetical protein